MYFIVAKCKGEKHLNIAKTVHKKAYAKVNLALDVLRRRPDGYHDVKMIMQNLDIYDELEFTLEPSKEVSITMEANRPEIPTDERNLIYKAIKLMFDEYNLSGKIHVKLIKNIPVEAGMAGGSTDCGAALHAINELFELNLDVETLMKLGVKIGADVPYCIMGKTALSEGIGEVLTPVFPLKDCYVLVVKPPIGVSTKMVYTNLKANELEKHPDVDGMIEALKLGDLEGVASRMENVLETVTAVLYPEIEAIKDEMKKGGALNAIMSGSGPTVFGLFKARENAEKAADVIAKKELAKEIFVTEPV